MGLCKRFKPFGQAGRDGVIARFQGLDPRKFTLQSGRDIYWRPADDPQALIKAVWRHGGFHCPCNIERCSAGLL
ncbi:hypothetical protein DSM25559_5451 [Agrobacterium rosae]|uniref:Uncharacterized protein n=2 Tax=Agrobacterium rosae TaxID=1972867 RepID=A0A1R3U3K9_9HYPH|nr:hypothetical protein DSM25559_5451 [Agrobacterium rosae]